MEKLKLLFRWKNIAFMLISDVGLKPYTNIAYHNSELKSLTWYRFNKVREQATLKTSIARLVNILFPELEKVLPTLHIASSFELLYKLPSAKHVAEVHLTHLTNLLYTASKSHYDRDKAIQIRNAAKNSIGTYMSAKALELKHTIPGVNFRMVSMIIADLTKF